MRKRVTAILLTLMMIIGMMPTMSFAVTGSQVAADGVYSSQLTAYKYKYGKLDKTYFGTLNVAVSDGEIAGLWISNASSDKMSKLITNEIYYTYVGEEASENAVEMATGVDGVTSASVTGSTSSVNSSVKKQYVADIKSAIISALDKAAANSSSSSSQSEVVKTVQGTAAVSDAEGSKLVLDVGLDSGGKIVSLKANDASVSDWSSVVSKNASSYIGKTQSQVDAISGATQYTTAVNTAVLAAMAKTESTDGGSTESGGSETGSTGTTNTDAGKDILPDDSATIAVGETVTLKGTHNSMASGEIWSSSNPFVATVAESGSSYDSDATVKGVKAGTVTITHTINSLFGSSISIETFTITVTNSGGSGSETTTGVTSITVKKEWKDDTESDRPPSVKVGIYYGSTKVDSVTLDSTHNWTATATGLDASKEYTVKEDPVEGYTSTVTKGNDTGSTSAGTASWTAQSYGTVEAGKTYAFTYTLNGTTYLLGRNGTSVIGTTSGLSGGKPSASIGDDYKWKAAKATSGTSYGEWLLQNLGNNYYLAPYNGYSTGYSNSAVLQSSNSYLSNVNLHFDDDGSIWNGYGRLNLYATSTTVKSDESKYTVFTPYLYSEGSSTAVKTANYTITNTKDTSGGGSGTGGGTGGGDEDQEEPAHVKSISPEGQAADSYTISLNVTGKSKTTSETTNVGEETTSPYDILLVLDNTRSMITSYGNTTRLAAMKSAAQSFVSGLPAADGAKVAMVSFTTGNYNSIVTTDVSWTDLNSGKSTVSSKISALNAPDTGYDTYFTQPLERASSLLDSVSSDGNKKFVVFFTDGAAAEGVSTIQSLASAIKGKADGTFSIGIVSGSTETQKAQALASASGNYYDVTTAGTMGSAFNEALSTIKSQTVETKVPMTGVTISDTLSKYVELTDENGGEITLSSSPEDNDVKIGDTEISEKEIKVNLNGQLKDDTVYTVNIPVKPSAEAQNEANGNDDPVSGFVSNNVATLTYRYGTEEAKTINYKETPKVYVAKEVTLTYDANAGTDNVTGMPSPISETEKVDATKEVASFNISNATPNRAGYTFLGWSKDKNAATAEYTNGAVEIDENTTLYAVWEKAYTITWKNEDGTVLETDENVKKGSTPSYNGATPTKAATTEYTYTFAGWTPEISDVTEDVTYKATYTATKNKYTVKFVDEGNKELSSEKYDYGTAASYIKKPADPTKAATAEYTYTFAGWTPTISDVTEDAIYTATYTKTKNQYNVTFESNGGTNIDPQTVEYGAKVKAPADPTRDDYYFAGWFTSDSFGKLYDFDNEVTENITLYAKWSQNVAKIEFDYNGGKSENKTSYITGDIGTVGGKVSVPSDVAEPERDGYTFAGWNIKADGTGDQIRAGSKIAAANGDTVTVYAQWTEKDVTITYNAKDGGSVSESSETLGVVTGKAVGSKATPNEGYKFVNWTDKSGKAVSTDAEFVPDKVDGKNVEATYTANFKKQTFTITFVDENGKVLEKQTVAYGDTPEYKGDKPTKAGNAQHAYEFTGWSPAITAATADVTYKAQYEESTNAYTITWKDSNGKTLETDQNVPYGATPEYNGKEPTKAATAEFTYKFAGWTPEVENVAGDKEYTATYKETKRSYTIKFVDENGNTLETKTVEYGTVPEYKDGKQTPTKDKKVETKTEKVPKLDEDGNPVLDEDGNPVMEEETVETNTTEYTFNGWDKDIVAVTGEATYKATYTEADKSEYQVKFVDDNGKVLSKKNYAKGTKAKDIDEPADPKKASTDQYTYEFAGWSPEISDVTGSATYTATYKETARKYTITFKDEDGTVLGTQEVEYGQVPEYKGKAPTKAATKEHAYSFSGWSPSLEEVTGDATYTAQYSAVTNKYTVTWNNYDGTTLEKDEDVLYGTKPSYDGKTPTRPDSEDYTYEFTGWSPKVSDVDGNATYTAEFKATLKEKPVQPTPADDTDDNPGNGGKKNTPNANNNNGNGGGTAARTLAPAAPAGLGADNTVIEDNETPLNNTPVTIEDTEPPLGDSPATGAWALINLICAILSLIIGGAMAGTYVYRSAQEQDEYEESENKKTKLLGIIPAIASIVIFVLTEDMSQPMAMVDGWTILMAIIAVGTGVLAFVTKNKKQSE